MPAAAVIPAPIAYLKVAAVKKLVVGSRGRADGPPKACHRPPRPLPPRAPLDALDRVSRGGMRNVYFEKIRVSKAGPVARIPQLGIME